MKNIILVILFCLSLYADNEILKEKLKEKLTNYNLKLPIKISEDLYELYWTYNESENLITNGFLLDYRTNKVDINKVIEIHEKLSRESSCESNFILGNKQEYKYLFLFDNNPIIIKSFIFDINDCNKK